MFHPHFVHSVRSRGQLAGESWSLVLVLEGQVGRRVKWMGEEGDVHYSSVVRGVILLVVFNDFFCKSGCLYLHLVLSLITFS